jgi:uncharacterized protein YkwD
MLLRRTSVALPALFITTLTFAISATASAGTSSRAMHHGRHHARAHSVQRTCENADIQATDASRQAMRAAVVCLINQQRATHHLPALHVAQDLNRSAQGWTNHMVDSGQFTHGVNFAGRMSAAGYTWSSAGENIATGFQTPWEVVKAWMASPDHCTNILDPTYSDVGTGLSNKHLADYGPSTWTQDFGLWMGHHAPSGNHGPQQGCPYHI